MKPSTAGVQISRGFPVGSGAESLSTAGVPWALGGEGAADPGAGRMATGRGAPFKVR